MSGKESSTKLGWINKRYKCRCQKLLFISKIIRNFYRYNESISCQEFEKSSQNVIISWNKNYFSEEILDEIDKVMLAI